MSLSTVSQATSLFQTPLCKYCQTVSSTISRSLFYYIRWRRSKADQTTFRIRPGRLSSDVVAIKQRLNNRHTWSQKDTPLLRLFLLNVAPTISRC